LESDFIFPGTFLADRITEDGHVIRGSVGGNGKTIGRHGKVRVLLVGVPFEPCGRSTAFTRIRVEHLERLSGGNFLIGSLKTQIGEKIENLYRFQNVHVGNLHGNILSRHARESDKGHEVGKTLLQDFLLLRVLLVTLAFSLNPFNDGVEQISLLDVEGI
jgi:hypothetical protein